MHPFIERLRKSPTPRSANASELVTVHRGGLKPPIQIRLPGARKGPRRRIFEGPFPSQVDRGEIPEETLAEPRLNYFSKTIFTEAI